MHDPITYKVFSQHVHIVFLKNTGNVFDMGSLQLLAIKPKTWRDLVSDEPFTRDDIVTIQVSHWHVEPYHTKSNWIKSDRTQQYRPGDEMVQNVD